MCVDKEDVIKLRDITGCGILACKKALEQVGGNFDEAVSILKKSGARVACKRSQNITNEGVVVARVSQDRCFGVIFGLCCETDFVSRTDIYNNFALDVANVAVENKIKSVDELNSFIINGTSVADGITNLIGRFRENIKIIYECISGNEIYCYNHFSKKLSSLVDINDSGCNDIDEAAKKIAMHIAATRPISVDKDSLDPDTLSEWKKEVSTDDLLSKGDNIRGKIIEGKLKKIFQDKVLLEQNMSFCEGETVRSYLQSNNIVVNSFKYISLY